MKKSFFLVMGLCFIAHICVLGMIKESSAVLKSRPEKTVCYFTDRLPTEINARIAKEAIEDSETNMPDVRIFACLRGTCKAWKQLLDSSWMQNELSKKAVASLDQQKATVSKAFTEKSLSYEGIHKWVDKSETRACLELAFPNSSSVQASIKFRKNYPSFFSKDPKKSAEKKLINEIKNKLFYQPVLSIEKLGVSIDIEDENKDSLLVISAKQENEKAFNYLRKKGAPIVLNGKVTTEALRDLKKNARKLLFYKPLKDALQKNIKAEKAFKKALKKKEKKEKKQIKINSSKQREKDRKVEEEVLGQYFDYQE